MIPLLECCTVAYGHPLTAFLFGESLHPGGLRLTSRLASMASIGPGSRVLDAGSGAGATAVHLAREFGAEVIGVTVEQEGVATAIGLAREAGVSDRTTFIQCDLNDLDASVGSFDVIVMECVLSIQADKALTMDRIRSRLRPGGRLALTDVTLAPGSLPASLHDVFATVGCLNGAVRLDQYAHLATEAGMTVELAQELPETAGEFVRHLRGRLLMVDAAIALGKLSATSRDALNVMKPALQEVGALVSRGDLGYALLIARAP